MLRPRGRLRQTGIRLQETIPDAGRSCFLPPELAAPNAVHIEMPPPRDVARDCPGSTVVLPPTEPSGHATGGAAMR
jgi:hypothetical protein